MAGLPTVQVLLDDGTGTYPYDVTTFARMVEGYKFTRGRQDELSNPSPGTFSLVFDNTDGRFTVGSTIIASPSPIKMDQKIRVKLTANATTVTRFTQAVQNWPTEWPEGSDQFSVAAISGTDVQSQAERRTLRSVIAETILADSPSAYYPLGEPTGATAAADTSGNQKPNLVTVGSGAPVTFGNSGGLTTDSLTVATFSAGQYLSTDGFNSPVSNAAEFWFKTTTVNQGLALPSVATGGPGGGLTIDGSGHLVAGVRTSAAVVTDGNWHHVYLTMATNDVVLDGVSLGGLTGTASSQLLIIGAAPGSGLATFTGSIAQVAAYNGVPSSPANHYLAGSTGFAGESGTARITRLAGYGSLTLGALDPSLTNVAIEQLADKKLMDAIRDVADAEMGLAYFDGSGSLVFHNRNRVAAKTSPDVTIDANFLAEGTRFEYDMQGVLNYFAVTATGTSVTQVARNLTSEVTNKHGRYDTSKTYLVQTDPEALDRANWLVSTHGEPAARVGSLAIDVLTMTAAQQATMLILEPDTWLRVTGLPGQTVGGTTADFIVQGFGETLTAAEWTIAANAANQPVRYPTPWILGDTTYSVLGSTTRLYV